MPLSLKTLNVVNTISALGVDALEEVPQEEVQDALAAITAKLGTYVPGDAPSVTKFADDAIASAEALADTLDKSADQKGDKITHEVGDFVESVLDGNFNPFQAFSLYIKAKKLAKAK